MNERPFLLRGNIYLDNNCIIGKIIINDNTFDKDCFIQVLDNAHLDLFEEGYLAYIFQSKPSFINNLKAPYCYNINNYETLINYDVIEINKNYIKVLYRANSYDNAIIVTNQCNSNCIMCPDSDLVRSCRENVDINLLIKQVRCIPSDAKYLTITGGEPGMLKDNLFILLNNCKEFLPNTEFLLLSNGRVFSSKEFTNKFALNCPSNIRVGIPLYANNSIKHDSITRARGSFIETINGIKNLLNRNIDIEIRVVVQKKNYKLLSSISQFIIDEIPKVKMVNFMALEMLGNSLINKEEVWVNFEDTKDYLYDACLKLIQAGIVTNLYNFPICVIDKRLYGLTQKSITDYKVKYKNECEGCKAKEICGGFFFSTINMKEIKVEPIK